jgi:hypothetical protein
MRNTMLAILALSAATVATAAGTSPAAAHDYPWCAQGRGVGYPGDCNYSTRQQCLWAADGRGLDCNLNPIFAFGQQQPSAPRGKAYRTYRDY